MAQNTTALIPDSAVIAFGYDEKRRPRGAWFAHSGDALVAALTAMSFQLLRCTPARLQEMGHHLSEGRLLSSGKLLLPSIRKGMHEKLVAASVEENFNELASTLHDRLTPQESVMKGASTETTEGSPWDDLRPGDLVLAPFGPDEGWWEACVVGRDRDIVTLKYPDYPDEPQITRHISVLARIHPDIVAS